jgi:hypothetical protein
MVQMSNMGLPSRAIRTGDPLELCRAGDGPEDVG